MSFANDVRDYCIENIVEPARSNGKNKIKIRAGDIHKSMKYKDRMPLVCSALGTKIFEKQARVKRLSVEGPTNGANCILEFEILT
jgi:hypothetical protein